jgi:hypothetical protein
MDITLVEGHFVTVKLARMLIALDSAIHQDRADMAFVHHSLKMMAFCRPTMKICVMLAMLDLFLA